MADINSLGIARHIRPKNSLSKVQADKSDRQTRTPDDFDPEVAA